MKIGSVFLLMQWAAVYGFAPTGQLPKGRFGSGNHGKYLCRVPPGNPTTSLCSSSSSSSGSDNAGVGVSSLKTELLEKIASLKRLQDEDGKIAVDFGVKGGEIDQKSRAPRKLDFYTVSERVGKAADSISETVDKLSRVNPTIAATAGLGDKNYDDSKTKPPLEGPWSLLFSTAADASFSKDSKRGDAKAGNIVDAKAGKMTNVIKFAPSVDENGKETPKAVDELRVKLSVTAEGPNRVDLVFKYVAVKFTKFLFLKFRWTLYIPVPGPTFGKIVVGLSNLKRRLLRRTDQPKRELPKAFFDVLFLDDDLRVHKTGEDNLFIQARPEWKAAWEIAA